MLNTKNTTRILMGFIMLGAFIFPRLSYADWGIGVSVGGGGYDHHDGGYDHHFYRWHDHPHYGYHIHYLPDGVFTIWVGGIRYYYYEGIYYSYVGHGDYVIVNPPEGAYVSVIPREFQPVIINGVTYYTDNGVYYVYTRHGYRVVSRPVVEVVQPPQVVVTQPAQVVVAQPAAVVVAPPVPVAQDAFTVNVPNASGGYTAVVLKKSGNGYLGPQGEFYAEFPKVNQLKAMYGK